MGHDAPTVPEIFLLLATRLKQIRLMGKFHEQRKSAETGPSPELRRPCGRAFAPLERALAAVQERSASGSAEARAPGQWKAILVIFAEDRVQSLQQATPTDRATPRRPGQGATGIGIAGPSPRASTRQMSSATGKAARAARFAATHCLGRVAKKAITPPPQLIALAWRAAIRADGIRPQK